MKRINKFVALFLLIFSATVSAPVIANELHDVALQQVNVVTTEATVNPLVVVSNPNAYLNKTIKMNARFDKFSTLGLDYPPAMRDNSEYIGFLILRDDTSFEIPLSEMKLFLKRDDAQKFVDLKTKDKISITGKVFSTALGDPWVDVEELKVIK